VAACGWLTSNFTVQNGIYIAMPWSDHVIVVSVIGDINILHTLCMNEYTTLHILHDWSSKIKKEKRRRDKLHVVGTTSESLDHLWAHAHACDLVSSM
jgi:hypothetical protein